MRKAKPMQVGRVKKKGASTVMGRGFTLVEVLVVMITLAILSAIAFPVFTKTKETARTAECLSNMRQIGLGLRMYLDDYDDCFPAAESYGAPRYWASKGRVTLQELLQPYVNSASVYEDLDGERVYTTAGVFQCPSDCGLPADKCDSGIRQGEPVWRSTGSSYMYYASVQEDWENSNVAVPGTSLSPLLASASGKERVGAPLSSIAFPTKKAVIGDLCYWHFGDRSPDDRLVLTNTLFADGHASRVKGSDHLEARLQQLRRWHSSTEISSAE